jgi:hypothetical protein
MGGSCCEELSIQTSYMSEEVTTGGQWKDWIKIALTNAIAMVISVGVYAYAFGHSSAETEQTIKSNAMAIADLKDLSTQHAAALQTLRIWQAETQANRFTSQDANALYKQFTDSQNVLRAELAQIRTDIAVIKDKVSN